MEYRSGCSAPRRKQLPLAVEYPAPCSESMTKPVPASHLCFIRCKSGGKGSQKSQACSALLSGTEAGTARSRAQERSAAISSARVVERGTDVASACRMASVRSEEHTSELQS